MKTIAEKLDGFGGAAPGFDGLRLAAAALVLLSHAFPITTGSDAVEPLYQLTNGQFTGGKLAVTLFFVVSGFVIAASLDRSERLIDFVWRRAIRLLPALAVVTLVALFVLGPLFTTTALDVYFGDPSTWRYLGNAVFLLDYTLPGVFAANVYPGAVNGSLWTLPWEVLSYIGMTVLWLVLPGARRVILPMAAIGALIVGLGLGRLDLPPPLARFEFLKEAALLFGAFLCGASLYAWRAQVPASRGLALGLLLTLPVASWLNVLIVWAPPVLAYASLVFCLQAFPRVRSDYSYGVYLWAWPVQQSLVALGLGTVWWSNAALALPLTFACAFASWTLVERPTMRLKDALKQRAEVASDPPTVRKIA